MMRQKTFAQYRSEISIMDMALSNGYTLQKNEGLKWPVLKNISTGDKIIIVNAKSVSNQGYFNADKTKLSDRGTLIRFIQNRLGTLFPFEPLHSVGKNIQLVLSGFQNLPVRQRFNLSELTDTKKLVLPELIEATKFPYLEARGIAAETYNKPCFAGKIFEATVKGHRNICFPYCSTNEAIIACEIRNNGIKFFLAGSDRSNSLWHSSVHDAINTIVLTESPIDALSYDMLKGKENVMYAAFGGSVSIHQTAVLRHIIQSKIPDAPTVVCAFDNDVSGIHYTHLIKDAFSEYPVKEDFPQSKDYNDDLKNDLNNKTQWCRRF